MKFRFLAITSLLALSNQVAFGQSIGDLSSANVTSSGAGGTTKLLKDWFANVPAGIGTAAAKNIGTSGATVPLLNTANTFSGTQTFTGTLALNGAGTNNFQQYDSGTAFTVTASPTCSAATYFFCSQSSLIGTVTGKTGAASWLFTDNFSSTDVSTMFQIAHLIAPNGNSSSGNRTTMGINTTQVGSLQSGSITTAGITSTLVTSLFMQSNLGGTASLPGGGGNIVNMICTVYSTATYVGGCSGLEIDVGGNGTPSYDNIVAQLLVETSTTSGTGRMGPSIGMEWGKFFSASTGFLNGIQFGAMNTWWPFQALNAKAIYIAPPRPGGGATDNLGAGIDLGYANIGAFAIRIPYTTTVPLFATGITGATRLTSDGSGTATSFIYDAQLTAAGSNYTTAYPTVTVTGCTGADVEAQLSGTVVGLLGVNNPGSACAAETTLSLSGGGGSGATGKAIIAGNTLNFGINSTIDVSCTLAASNLAHSGTDAVGWRIRFGMKMGATASTTVSIGSPSWVLDYQTAGAAAKFSGGAPAAPTADTTLGAVNLSITPLSATWDVAGWCNVTKTSQL